MTSELSMMVKVYEKTNVLIEQSNYDFTFDVPEDICSKFRSSSFFKLKGRDIPAFSYFYKNLKNMKLIHYSYALHY